jgi:hypothetical protein
MLSSSLIDSVMDEGDMLSMLAALAILPVSAAAIKYLICRSVISMVIKSQGRSFRLSFG